MILADALRAAAGWYKERFGMPAECAVECAERNARRLKRVLRVTLGFGIVMCIITFLMPGARTPVSVALRYYSIYVFLSALPLAALGILEGRRFAQNGTSAVKAKNAVCHAALTAVQLLCIYQKTLGFEWEGYLVWTIAALVILAVFNINPLYFLITIVLQFAYIIVYESMRGNTQFLNMSVLVVVTVLLSHTLWSMRIREYHSMKALREANRKSDELLHNFLPDRVVNDLRNKGSSDPQRFENVSILFTDLVNFTDISSELEPEYLIGELSDLFCGFDCIIEKYGCTRIKTIGDAYMAVCGLPESDSEHAEKIVQAGLECLEYLRRRNEHSKIVWKMRVGVHSGPVVAGIVGVRKYIYDIFGDSVNIASRMENASREMKVNVSEETWNLVKDKFTYQDREPQRIKGKGLMHMYFVEERKGEIV